MPLGRHDLFVTAFADGAEAEAWDPRIPRKLLPEHALRKRGVWDFQPFGLRSLGNQLYACDTDSNITLQQRGVCGLLGTGMMLRDSAVRKDAKGVFILPVRRWDDQLMAWTAENAPYVRVPPWRLPRNDRGTIDFEAITALPNRATRESPGELPDAVAGSAEAALPALALAEALRRQAPRRSRGALCRGFLWPEQRL
mmetsp:Transcript_99866/g.311106  ORF Transcript_99866/g.311106 Transcript_99866/m.311106 type:complete len:197 (+) Transcript_99866:38-628(+)